jgi:nicotinate-nucleotide adenylyltransferase
MRAKRATGNLMKIALFGGTFDPIHHAHLLLARAAREQFAFDQVIFIPAAESPFKPDGEPANGKDRLAMIQLAIAGEPAFAVDPLEIDRGGVSYSIDTVRIFAARFPQAELFLLIGEDHARSLRQWHEFEVLEKLVRFVVLSRSADAPTHSYPVVQQRFDISATDIRNRVANNLPITYLVPEPVLRFIDEKRLYRKPSDRT